MINKLRSILRGAPAQPVSDMSADSELTDGELTDEQVALATEIWDMHAVLDNIYGDGFSKANPGIVAQHLLAASLARSKLRI